MVAASKNGAFVAHYSPVDLGMGRMKCQLSDSKVLLRNGKAVVIAPGEWIRDTSTDSYALEPKQQELVTTLVEALRDCIEGVEVKVVSYSEEAQYGKMDQWTALVEFEAGKELPVISVEGMPV
jgi:hypothetical protein